MKNKLNKELAVCGYAAVKSLAENHPEKIKRLYFTEERAVAFGDVCRLLSQRKAPYNMVQNEEELVKLSGSVHHQGVVAMINLPEIIPLDSDITLSWLHEKQNALILDRVGNANNLGAIVRSAAFFGVKNIVIPLDEAQSSITTSSYRVAQGGMEFVTIYSVNSTVRLLESMAGKMIRVGTALETDKPVSEINSFSKEKTVLLVLGNEETGISSEVRKNCDTLVIIPFAGMADGIKKPAVESLNVAQAASVILYELSKK